MNLADAIRRAALSSGTALGQPEPRAQHEDFTPIIEQAFDGGTSGDETQVNTQDLNGRHNTVRLELVLNPEQLKGFFGAVIASQHSVLTLREAANFLRVSQTALEKMAQNGEVPGIQVDGKWRFTRPALEDWLWTQPTRKEA